MGIKERHVRDRETVRRAILDAARELFVAEGFQNVSIRKIAERIEYSPAAIYGYFPSKDDIFFALAEEGFRLLCDRGAARPAGEMGAPTPLDRVRDQDGVRADHDRARSVDREVAQGMGGRGRRRDELGENGAGRDRQDPERPSSHASPLSRARALRATVTPRIEKFGLIRSAVRRSRTPAARRPSASSIIPRW